MTKTQYRKNHRICLIIAVTLAIVLMVHMAATTIRGQQGQQEEQTSTETTTEVMTLGEQMSQLQEVQRESVDEAADEEQTPDRYEVFDTMSADWGADDVEGFKLYAIPDSYERAGGYFPEKMQVYTYCVCNQYGVRYDLVIALIEHESGYVFDKVGDDGHSIGYMQIYETWHIDRMERLNCDDLTNPYQNILVGVDYLAELYEKYGTWQDTLTAYNYGEKGAYTYMWSRGRYVYDYNSGIMSRMKEIEEELR